MSFPRRGFIRSLFAAAALVFALPVLAQTAGKDYKLISPTQPTDNPAKIEVVEFFSYGCPHCSDFHPMLSAWAARLPDDVVLKRVPVSFGRGAWANIARLYYALEITGDLARLDGEVFKAIHNDRVSLFEEKTLKDWVVKKGVDPVRFNEAFGAFGTMSKARRADQMAQNYKIEGVPAIAIDGKYLITGGDFNDTLDIANKLIAKARSEKTGKAHLIRSR